MIKTYRELSRLETFEERYRYLRLGGAVGSETFGSERYLNQRFYTSQEWRRMRNHAIARDLGCDLGIQGYEIYDKIIIHHINPMTPDMIRHSDESILDLDNLICVSNNTHLALHFGDESLLVKSFVERTPGDTKLW